MILMIISLFGCTDPTINGPLMLNGGQQDEQIVDTSEYIEEDSGLDTGEADEDNEFERGPGTGGLGNGSSDKEDPVEDLDKDGYTLDNDCNESDPEINIGATEQCFDGIDNDCDGLIDEEDPDTEMMDCDGDGWSVEDGDCDDSDADIYPYAPDEDPFDSVNENCGYEDEESNESEEDETEESEEDEEEESTSSATATVTLGLADGGSDNLYVSAVSADDAEDFGSGWEDTDGGAGTSRPSVRVEVAVDAAQCGRIVTGNEGNSGVIDLCMLESGNPVVSDEFAVDIEHASVSYDEDDLVAVAYGTGAYCYLQISADTDCDPPE